MKAYRDLRLTFQDRSEWSLPRILRARTASHGEATYLDVPSSGHRLTYNETLDLAERVASGLLGAGGRPGDRLLIMAPNSAAYMAAWFGAAFAGMVEAPINIAYRGAFLRHQTSVLAPRFAVIDASFAESFVEVSAACKSIERFYLLGAELERSTAAKTLASAGFRSEAFETLCESPRGTLPDVGPTDLGAILFTSGTTGPSKGVMMPHAQMYFFADETVSLTRLTETDVYMSVGPLFHANAQFLAAYPAMVTGARFVLQERFSPASWLKWTRECDATVTNLLGVMSDFVWRQPEGPNDADNRLRCVFSAPTPWTFADRFRARFGIEAFVEAYGMTEISVPILSPYGEDRPPGTAGALVEEFFEVRLVKSETDEEVRTGELGELIVRPKLPWTICSGYFGMPDRTAEAFRNLWFHTGDGLRRDGDGWYYFVDRLKDAIRRRGENISSYEVEQAILPHPGVAECAVVAVRADEGGEDEVLLLVVPETDRPEPEELWDWCGKHLPHFAVPRYIDFIDALPKTPNEKVQKSKLRDRGIGPSTADRGPDVRRPGTGTRR